MIENFQLHRFPGQVQGKSRTHGKFQTPLERALCQKRNRSCATAAVEVSSQIGIEKNPTAAIEPTSQTIYLNHRRGHLASVLYAPGEGIQAGINRACRSFSVIKIHGAQADHWTKS